MMELGDFALGFAEGCRASKGLCYGLAVYFAKQTKLRIVTWIIGLGAMTVRFPATADYRADRSWAKISEFHKLLQDAGALGFQIGYGL